MTQPMHLPALDALSSTRRSIYTELLGLVDRQAVCLNMSTMRFDGPDGQPISGEQNNLLDLFQYGLISPASDYEDGGLRPMSITDTGCSFLAGAPR